MKKVLVTGASGFVGRQCLKPLVQRGFEVCAVSRGLGLDIEPDVHWYRADLLEMHSGAELIRRLQPSHWLHLAWITTHGVYWNSPENLTWVQATLRMLEAFVEHGGQRLVMVGTCAEYDWNHGYCREEGTPLAPATFYGTCKHATRLLVEAVARQRGLSAAWARLFFMYGPYEHPDRLVPAVIRALLRGEPARCTHGRQVRDFLHIADVGDALGQLLDSTLCGPINVASGQPVAVKDIALEIGRQIGRPELVQLGAQAARPDDPPLLLADVRRLERELGWTPRWDLASGLRQTISWWRRAGGPT
ncbi:MAG: NAD(P)-dependent oxidoreductase [Gemmataceae bacterium]|nr:NAD(P)-dependent oxidoreductase [Gemmataceae bacterium]MDW8266157.1 NAD(P)-dependent oxidoreductase [Gemmataceae bacterium]